MIHEDTIDFLTVLGYVDLVHGKGQDAIPLFKALRILRPNAPGIAASLAYAYLQASQWEACLVETKVSLKMSPPDGVAKSLRLIQGRALWSLKRRNEAVAFQNVQQAVSCQ